MKERRHSAKNWGLLVASSLISIVVGIFLYSRATQTPQENDSESYQTVQEAEAIVKGCHRYGLIEYSHHPIGRAYLLTPFIGHLDRLERVPLVIGVIAAALTLFACLMVPAPLLVKAPIIATFTALAWQGGFIGWVGNLHQHSYNFSITLLLIAVGVSVRRSWPALAALAFIAGWIGYDFIFIYPFTIVTVRFLYWSTRENNGWVRAAWAAIGETCLFLAVFTLDMTLKFVQNTLYFSSAVMAQQDLFLNILYRTSAESSASMTLSWRFEKAARLVHAYFNSFITGDRLSHRESLLAICGFSLLIVLAHMWRVMRARQHVGLSRRWAVIIVAMISSSMTILGWLFLAPNHAEPHVSLFARLLLIPCILLPLCVSLGFAYTRSDPTPASTIQAGAGVGLFLVSASIFFFLPSLASGSIDRTFYTTAWDSQSAGIRNDIGLGDALAATPTSSSTSTDSDLTGPLKLKGGLKLVYVTNFWGRTLDENKSLRWIPDPTAPLPAWYQVNFPKPVTVSHIALRFWDLPKNCGKNTPEIFSLEVLDQNAQVLQRIPLSESSVQVTHQGKYLNLLVPISFNGGASGLRLVIEKTVGGGAPVLFDFHVFGTQP